MANEKRKNFLSDLSQKFSGSERKSGNNSPTIPSNVAPTQQQIVTPRPPPVQNKPGKSKILLFFGLILD
jgi:hypothetical protein